MGRAVNRSWPERVPAARSGMTGRRGTAGLLAWPAGGRGPGASAGACLGAGKAFGESNAGPVDNVAPCGQT